jgi:phosphinothricin acetyltransferase
MTIRDADAGADGAACAAVYAPYVTDSVISFEAEPPSAAEMTSRIATLQATHPWLVLERDGVVAGYAYGSPHHPRAAYRWAADVSVYVAREHHRTGAGRALYTELLRRLDAQGFRTVCAGVSLPNDASVGLHEALGFVPVGVYRAVGWKHGAWWDVGWWQLDLRPPSADTPAEPRLP